MVGKAIAFLQENPFYRTMPRVNVPTKTWIPRYGLRRGVVPVWVNHLKGNHRTKGSLGFNEIHYPNLGEVMITNESIGKQFQEIVEATWKELKDQPGIK